MEKAVLIQLIEQDKTIRAIAQELENSPTTVRYWLKKLGLKTQHRVSNRKDKYVCKYCGTTRRDDFVWRSQNRQCKSVCVACHSEIRMNRLREYKQLAVESKGGKCTRCGYNKCLGALEFHHRDPKQKDPKWQSMRSCSLKRILKEVEKCDLVCSNCHREIHAGLW